MIFKYSYWLILLLLFSSCSYQDSTIIIEVTGDHVACEDPKQQNCLKVKFQNETQWVVLNQDIEGFSPTAGMDYTLSLKKIIEADDATVSYKLMEIISSIPTPISLGDGSWNIASVLDENTFTRAPFITLTLEENRIHGSTGCNKFFGTLVTDDVNFKVKDIGLTKMACENMNSEAKFLRALESVTHYEVIGETLHLLSSDAKILIKAKHFKQRQ